MNPAISIRIREIIRQICDSKDIQIIKGNVSLDHVHVYVSYPPKISVSEMVRFSKDGLRKKFRKNFHNYPKSIGENIFGGLGMLHLVQVMLRMR